MMESIISANKLEDGSVVYLTDDHDWSHDIDHARVAIGEDEAVEALGVGENAENQGTVIGVCLVDVVTSPSGIQAKSMKQVIRAVGPSCTPRWAPDE